MQLQGNICVIKIALYLVKHGDLTVLNNLGQHARSGNVKTPFRKVEIWFTVWLASGLRCLSSALSLF